MEASFQKTVKREQSQGPQQTYLIAYIQNGDINSVILKGLSTSTKTYGGTDLELISREVIKHIDSEEDIKIIAITDLGMQ